MKPIYDHRIIIGYAKTPKQAQKIVKELLQHMPKNWKITVKERSGLICDLYGLDAGFVYCVHP